MIEWFTSVVYPWPIILDAATRFYYEHVSCFEGCAAVLVEEPAHMIPRQQAAWADYAVIAKHRKAPRSKIVVASTSEIAILRTLYRVRQESGYTESPQELLFESREALMRGADVRVHCLTQGGEYGQKPGGIIDKVLRVRDEGEFLDVWPDGFFDERMKELF